MLPPSAPPRARVLIVDDDAGVRNVCTTLLRALGYHTDATSNGLTALASLHSNEQHVQLLLLDLELPGMHGDVVLRRVKATLPNVRVLVMSGKPGCDLRRSLAEGADGVLQKPFGMEELDDSVGAALRN